MSCIGHAKARPCEPDIDRPYFGLARIDHHDFWSNRVQHIAIAQIGAHNIHAARPGEQSGARRQKCSPHGTRGAAKNSQGAVIALVAGGGAVD